ncbi:MAG: hypothetical protein K5756_07360 [Clostridiales bacterium]|nr:hypothetical protein [Clostridiales bacterium]
MRSIIRIFLPILLIFALFSACTKEKQIDIFILLSRFNSFSKSLSADETAVYLSPGEEAKYSVPVTVDDADRGLLTAYPNEHGSIKSVSITAKNNEDNTTAMQALICAFTGMDEVNAYEVIKELTEPPVEGKIRYTQTVSYRFAYTVNEPGHYFSVEDKKYISDENAEFTLRQTTSSISSQ